jgi:LysM repeat protein
MSKKYENEFDEIIEEVVEDLAETIEEVIPEPVKVAAKTYTVATGDTFPSIAAKFKPSGKSKHEYAKELLSKNGSLTIGKVISL